MTPRRLHLRRRGVFCLTDRRAALLDLAGQAPAPVLADLLGLHISAATRGAGTRRRHQAGYQALRNGEHRRSSRGRGPGAGTARPPASVV
jgi:hypothetical protein